MSSSKMGRKISEIKLVHSLTLQGRKRERKKEKPIVEHKALPLFIPYPNLKLFPYLKKS